jgi:predicted transcriptional regulator of viral defense system
MDNRVDRFIMSRIESLPHLEGLLLLWRNQNDLWTVEQVAERLWIAKEHAGQLLENLTRQGLISRAEEGCYRYPADSSHAELMQSVDRAYRNEMIRISTMIHERRSAGSNL